MFYFNIKKYSLTQILFYYSKIFGIMIFQYPSENFKVSLLGFLFLALKLFNNYTEVYSLLVFNSDFYFGSPGIFNVISWIEIIVYAIHHVLVSILNIFLCKKVFKVYKEIEALAINVCSINFIYIKIGINNFFFQIDNKISFRIFISLHQALKIAYCLKRENCLGF